MADAEGEAGGDEVAAAPVRQSRRISILESKSDPPLTGAFDTVTRTRTLLRCDYVRRCLSLKMARSPRTVALMHVLSRVVLRQCRGVAAYPVGRCCCAMRLPVTVTPCCAHDACCCPSLTEGQLAKARRLYDKYDTDGSNDIDKSELANILRELNLRLTTEMFDKFVWSYWNATDVDVRCAAEAEVLPPPGSDAVMALPRSLCTRCALGVVCASTACDRCSVVRSRSRSSCCCTARWCCHRTCMARTWSACGFQGAGRLLCMPYRPGGVACVRIQVP